MRTRISRRLMARYSVLALLVLLMAAGCSSLAGRDERGYPAPPATQFLATLVSRGVATTDRTEYPPPIPGPLAAVPTGSPTAPASAFPPPAALEETDPPQAVQAARIYLAGYLSLPVAQVELLTWEEAARLIVPTDCLGSSGFELRIPAPGYRSVLRANQQTYQAFSDQNGENICLVEGQAPGERVPLPTIQSQDEIVELARQDLAEQLDVPLEQVKLVSVEQAEFEGMDLGCGAYLGNQPDRAYPHGIPGLRILLEVAGQQYEYHSGGPWMKYCVTVSP